GAKLPSFLRTHGRWYFGPYSGNNLESVEISSNHHRPAFPPMAHAVVVTDVVPHLQDLQDFLPSDVIVAVNNTSVQAWTSLKTRSGEFAWIPKSSPSFEGDSATSSRSYQVNSEGRVPTQ